jgi:hypothetical protein
MDGKGSANGYHLKWTDSASYADPDFAGYIVERAPAFSGGFTPLAAEPSRIAGFEDPLAAVGETYRYRVVTYDVSGNSAIGPVVWDGPVAAEKAEPVAVLKLPRGPFYGPVTVEANMSDSYDPEGEGITTYTIQVFNPWPVPHPGPIVDLDLNPGCHIVLCSVTTGDGRTDQSIASIKVLPQWEPASQLIRATDPTLIYKDARLSRFRAGVQPSDGLTTLCGQDTSAGALTFWHQNGAQMLPYRAPSFEFITYVGEPATVGDALVFPVASVESYLLASFDGTQVVLNTLGDIDSNSSIALVKDNAGKLWYVVPGEEGLNDKLFINEVGGALAQGDLATPADSVDYLDAVLEPGSGHIFAFYDDGAALHYAEYDPAAALAIGSGALGVPNFAFVLDAEVNPENGRVGVLFYDVAMNRNSYLEQDGLGGWTAPQIIDNSLDSVSEADLCPSDGGKLNAFFPLDNGQQAHRYINNAGVWSPENTVAYSADSGYEIALCPVPGSPDMRVADNCGDGVIRLARLKAGNTENVFAQIDSAIGQGLDMHAAAGTDGLHLIFSNVHEFDKVTHMLSPAGPDEGSVWNEVNSFLASGGLNLENTSEGAIYATGYMAPDASLYYWDSGGGNFMPDYSAQALVSHRPILGPGYLDDEVTFGVWDDAGVLMHTIHGKHLGPYDPPQDYLLIESPVWEGTFSGVGGSGGFYALTGPIQTIPRITFHQDGSIASDILETAVIGGENSPYGSAFLAGRLIDSAAYWNGELLLGGFAFDVLLANGGLFWPARLESGLFGGSEVVDIHLGTPGSNMDLQRSVSVATVNGLTGLELIATTDGREVHFAWSNFGDWESLPLPEGLEGMTLPLVTFGNDGRWHIIYKNWKTDEIMIRSTV